MAAAVRRSQAAALKLGGSRRTFDPNRPKPQLSSESRRELYDLAIEYADRYLEPEEITATFLLVEKRMLVQEGARLAEDTNTPLDTLREKIHEFLDFAPGEAVRWPSATFAYSTLLRSSTTSFQLTAVRGVSVASPPV
jgi:hypothetical protein